MVDFTAKRENELSRFRYVTFDCYGTLIDWRKGIGDALTELLGGAGLSADKVLQAYTETEKEEERTYKKYREVLKASSMRAATALGMELDESKAAKFADSLPSWPAYPDTVDSLKKFGKMGLKRYILSNVDVDLLQGTIKNTGMEIDGFVVAEDVKSYKPSPAHWEAFLRKTGSTKSEVLHTAESMFHDIIPATRLGIATAWVNRYRKRLAAEATPSFVTENLQDLVAIID